MCAKTLQLLSPLIMWLGALVAFVAHESDICFFSFFFSPPKHACTTHGCLTRERESQYRPVIVAWDRFVAEAILGRTELCGRVVVLEGEEVH